MDDPDVDDPRLIGKEYPRVPPRPPHDPGTLETLNRGSIGEALAIGMVAALLCVIIVAALAYALVHGGGGC